MEMNKFELTERIFEELRDAVTGIVSKIENEYGIKHGEDYTSFEDGIDDKRWSLSIKIVDLLMEEYRDHQEQKKPLVIKDQCGKVFCRLEEVEAGTWVLPSEMPTSPCFKEGDVLTICKE